jgi:hypothetical protein
VSALRQHPFANSCRFRGRAAAAHAPLTPLPRAQEASAGLGGRAPGAGRPTAAAGGGFKPAAAAVLRRAGRPLSAREICRLALEWGLLPGAGRTAEASMASALGGDLKRRDRASPFSRAADWRFGLREWRGAAPARPADTASASPRKRPASSAPPDAASRALLSAGEAQSPDCAAAAAARRRSDVSVGGPAAAAAALAPTFGSPGAGAAASIAAAAAAPADEEAVAARQLAALEAKVAAVEARWGALHPNAGRAHLLLYGARPPAARAAAALRRADAVAQHCGRGDAALAARRARVAAALRAAVASAAAAGAEGSGEWAAAGGGPGAAAPAAPSPGAPPN